MARPARENKAATMNDILVGDALEARWACDSLMLKVLEFIGEDGIGCFAEKRTQKGYKMSGYI